ncbi:MAG: hypothetical protein EBT06_05370 [Gammaproteobacteria bacterium]|nr:hypothetical protein [Gammaproteobacteria bacterium]NBT44343.1 hypothetical protein [Gammaproteobacteria bacterium]NDG88072.1 hypothetical protein [Gammaproteobacteria bacterium]
MVAAHSKKSDPLQVKRKHTKAAIMPFSQSHSHGVPLIHRMGIQTFRLRFMTNGVHLNDSLGFFTIS